MGWGEISLRVKHPEEMTVVEEIIPCPPKAQIRILEWLLALEAQVHGPLTIEGSCILGRRRIGGGS